jgi:hypothetical protein
MHAEMKAYIPDSDWKDLYYLDDIDKLTEDAIAAAKERYVEEHIYDGQEQNLKENYIFNEVLREVRDDIGDNPIAKGPLFTKIKANKSTDSKAQSGAKDI